MVTEPLNYKLKDLLDIPKLQSLLDAIDEVHSLPSAIIDAEGNILTATAWQDICTKFHRAYPAAEKKCIESDSYIAKELVKNPPHVIYKCPFGLVDTATPIIVEGRHLGNVFTGQLFTEPPDQERFVRQAREYGFDEQDYLEALKRVPIISEERLRKNLAFLGKFTEMLAQQGLIHLRQRQTEIALRTSEDRAKAMLRAIPDIVFRLNGQGVILDYKAERSDLYARSEESIIGRRTRDVSPPEFADLIERKIKATLESGKLQTFEYELPIPGRGTRYYEARMAVSGAEEVTAVVRDITEGRQSIEDLKRSEALYHDLAETSQDLIWQCDAEGRFVYLNRAWETAFGYRVDEMLGRKFTDFQAPEMAVKDLKVFGQLMDGGMIKGYETTHINKDGYNIHLVFNGKAVIDAQGKIVGTRGTAYDITERRRTEEALRDNAAQFRALVEQSLTGVALIQDMKFVYVNPRLAQITGYTPDELIGRSPIELLFADDDRAREKIDRLLSGEIENESATFRARHKSGTAVILEIYGRTTAYQRRPAILTTILDITERKKLEDVARLDHRRMASLLKISQSKSTSMHDLLDHALDEAVALSESRLGYIYYYDEGKGEFALHSWSRSVMKECSIADPQKVYQLEKTGIWGEAVRQRKPIVVNDFRAPHPLKKGCPEGHAPLNRFMTLPVFVDGRIVAVVGVANKEAEYDNTDVLQLAAMMDSIWKIAEHRRLDDDLRKLSQAVEQSPVSIVITDTRGDIEFVNPRFTQLTGYRLDEVLGRNPRVLKSGETPPETYQALWAAITAGKVWEGDFHNRKKNGQLFWEHAAISPIRDGDGNITHYLGIKEDITERKKLEEQLRQAQKMEAIGQLAGGVAHDFNNILSTITGYASLLEMTVTSDETLREYISEITVASERGANLTKSLLAFSRKQEALLAPVDLNQQIRSSHKILSRLIGEDIDLVLDLDRRDITVDADASQLQQVLMNLASNARDAMPHGGSLRIATKMDVIGDDHRERYSLERPGRYALISLADTGVGMEQGVRQHIFEPFFTTKGIGKGTGLGLSIVFGMVQKHKGSVQVESEPGKGTVFTIYLPLSEKGVSGSDLGDRIRPRAGGQTILLVEDEEPVRRVIRLILESFGYKIIEAADGEEAVQIFRENQDRVHLVLCDLVMPKRNGSEAYAEMRKIRPDIKAIFMSGYTKDIFDTKGISDAEITLLMKPLNPLDLVGKISEALQEGPGLPPENR